MREIEKLSARKCFQADKFKYAVLKSISIALGTFLNICFVV